ncbi:branched-chain amino acid ABC transporter permease [Actinacidiphila bryophytorum]|uniref:branched-chain amino acid ABC transporter permease n=1 Tax=Actinacidiphila bryophytorum TaxID=1436133 RepID=UPI002176CEC1|nr:branched-chain amino acid ABC transporter permease [Actinacidiphila bryophytorum]UWE12228.1 branched-chain amino acid ABC transporter permease [Actinacidiphila bryophytorum]
MILALVHRLAGRPAWIRWGLLAVGLFLAALLPWVLYPPVATDILCWGLFAVAFDLLLGHAGLLSFGHAAFWGGSAYVTGLIALHSGLPFYAAVLGGAVAAALLALPIGYLAVRRSGIYFAMITLAFAQMVYFVANQWSAVTGGENGLQGIPRTLPGTDLSDAFTFYYAALPVVLLGLAAAHRIVRSPFGRVTAAIRDNPDRVRALGYSADRYKLTVFTASAFLSGLAGGLFAVNHGFASLQEVDWTTSGKVVVMTVLGGIGTLWGSLIGAAAIVRLEDWLSTAGFEQTDLVTGSVFIVVVLLFRQGLWGTATHLLRPRRPTPPPPSTSEESDPEPHLAERP